LRPPPVSRSASARRLVGDTRGAAAIEFAFVIGLAIVLVIGTLQVGRALMARNEVSHALSQAVRVVHLEPQTTREQIEARLESLLDGYHGRAFNVEVTEIAGTTYMQIAVEFPVEIAVPLLPVQTVTMRVDTLAPMVSPLQQQ
jgi:Flp pilus assembly protein TadG